MWRGSLGEAVERWGSNLEARGEFTIVIAPAPPAAAASTANALILVDVEITAGSRLSEAVRIVAADTGVSRRDLYEAALRRRGDES